MAILIRSSKQAHKSHKKTCLGAYVPLRLVLRHLETGDESFGVVSEAHSVDAVG